MDKVRAFGNILVFCLLLLSCPNTGPLPLQVSDNNINWRCPDRMRQKKDKETHLKKWDVEIKMGNKNEIGNSLS